MGPTKPLGLHTFRKQSDAPLLCQFHREKFSLVKLVLFALYIYDLKDIINNINNFLSGS